VATLVGVQSGELMSSRDVISQSTSLLAPVASRFSDVAELQLAV
jgi:hypothetical protein